MLQLSGKQKEYWQQAMRRWNVKAGATRSGKTYLDYWLIPRRIRACRGEGLILLLGNTRSTLERNVLAPMREIWGDCLVGRVGGGNTVKLFGKTCYALGADKVSQVQKLQGAGVEYCYGDEVTTWNEQVFRMLQSRLDKPHSLFDGTCNPDSPNHWFKRFLGSGADIFQQSYQIDDNPFLASEFVSNLKREYAGTVFYDRFILGKWTLAQGLVYPMFDPVRHVFVAGGRPSAGGGTSAGGRPLAGRSTGAANGATAQGVGCAGTGLVGQGGFESGSGIGSQNTRPNGPSGNQGMFYISIDYGTANPCSMGLWQVERGMAYRIGEFYHDSRKAGRQMTDEEYYNALENLADGRVIQAVIVDPSAASFIETIRRRGRFPVRKAKNDVLYGIRTVASLLNSGRLLFADTCQDAIREFALYSWDEDAPGDRVLKTNDHAMDEIRYFCATILRREWKLSDGKVEA